MLSFFYHLLSRFKEQDDVTQDMGRTFEEARVDAHARGWWSYSIFAVREVGGLLGLPTRERWWLRTAGWALAGLATGWIVSFVLPAHYTSEATLLLVPPKVSQDLLPHDPIDIGNLLDRTKPMVLSRSVLTTIVTNFDLYRAERRRQPMEDVLKDFRKSVHLEPSGANLVRVTFTYPDRLLASKVTQDLVSRVIVETLVQKSNSAWATEQFFQDQVDGVGKSWLKASASLKATPATDPRYELLTLERDQKRKEYESVAQKLGTAQTLKDLASRGQDARFELLDAASVPYQPDTPPSIVEFAGFGCGLAIGLLIALRRTVRRTSSDFAVPDAVEPA